MRVGTISVLMLHALDMACRCMQAVHAPPCSTTCWQAALQQAHSNISVLRMPRLAHERFSLVDMDALLPCRSHGHAEPAAVAQQRGRSCAGAAVSHLEALGRPAQAAHAPLLCQLPPERARPAQSHAHQGACACHMQHQWSCRSPSGILNMSSGNRLACIMEESQRLTGWQEGQVCRTNCSVLTEQLYSASHVMLCGAHLARPAQFAHGCAALLCQLLLACLAPPKLSTLPSSQQVCSRAACPHAASPQPVLLIDSDSFLHVF